MPITAKIADSSKFLLLLEGKKNVFEEMFKNWDKDTSVNFYLFLLNKIKDTLLTINTEFLIKYCKFISYINHVTDRETLQIYFNHPDNPLKNTNVVILSCKFNNSTILQFILGESEIQEQLSIGIGRKTIEANEEDNENHNAFYYGIREGNVLLLEALKEKWGSTSKDYFICLAKAYEELRLKNINISIACEVCVEKQLVNNRFFSKITKKMTNDLSNIPQRIYMVVDVINHLYSEYFNTVINEKFLYSVNFIARNVHILKNQLKLTYDSIPWEEMEFILIAFIKAQVMNENINLLIKSLLNKNYLLQHLKNFTNDLIYCLSIIPKSRSNNCHPKMSRKEVVRNIIQRKPYYVNLYEVYSQIRDIDSLNIICTYLKLALKYNSSEEETQLIITRTLQIVGEHLKSTVQSPKMSPSMSQFLMMSMPKHVREVISKIRDTLSHGCLQTTRNEEVPGKTYLFFNVKSDLEKIKNIIEKLLSKRTKEIVRLILQKLLDCDNVEEMKDITETFQDMKQICFQEVASSLKSQEKNVKHLIVELKQKIKNITLYEEDLLSQVEKTSDSNSLFCNEKKEYIYALIRLSTTHLSVSGNKVDENMARTIKWSIRQFLSKLSREETDKENVEILAHLNEIRASLFSRLKEDENILNISNILFQIYSAVQLESVSYQWVEEFLDVLRDNNISTEAVGAGYERKTDSTKLLVQRVSELKTFLQQTFSVETDTKKVEKYKKNKSLQAILEILLLDILSILGDKNKVLVGNNVFLDNYSPLLTGRNLRNHLAHRNVLIDIISSDPSTAIFINALSLGSQDIANVTCKKIGQNDREDLISTRGMYEEKLLLLDSQQKMFNALTKGDLSSVKKYVENGADIKGRSLNLWTSLHFAAKGPSLECVKYVIDHGISAYSKDLCERSPLHISAIFGRVIILQYLIEEQNMPVNDVDINKITCLHLAAQYGHKEAVDVLLKNKASTDAKNTEGMSPIHFAVRNNHEDVVKILLERERHVDANEVRGGFTPLHIAAECGHTSLVHFLLQNRANINAISDRQHCPIHTAALHGHLEVIKILISKNAHVNVEVPGGGTPLHFAVENGHDSVAKVLLDNGANPNGSKTVLDFPPPLCYAAKDGNMKLVEMLIEYGAEVNLSSKEHLTPLHYASLNNHANVVDLLVKNHASINSTVNGITVLHMTIKLGNVDTFKYLIEVVPKGTFMKYSSDLVCLAAENGNVEIIEHLLSLIPDVNYLAVDGNAPLHIACFMGHALVAEKIIWKGANINSTNKRGWSPLHCAVKSGVVELVESLIDKEAELLVFDSMHCTPVHIAAFLNKIDIMKILLKHIDNPNIKSPKGKTPLYLAVLNNHMEVTELLIDHGANVNDGPDSDILSCAVENNNKDIVCLLLRSGADVNSHFGQAVKRAVLTGSKHVLKVLLNDKNLDIKMHTNIIMVAVRKNNSSIVQLLLEHGANPHVGDDFSGTPLHHAAAKGMNENARLLLKHGANANCKFFDGTTPLHLAAKFGYKDVVSLLLNNGAERSLTTLKQQTSLQLAVSSGHIEVIDLLLEKNKINDVFENCNNYTLLHIAAQYGYVEVTDYLIKRGASALIKNGSGSKPIHIAAREGHTPLVEYYLNKMISINDVGVAGQSLLHYAAHGNQVECAKYLINKGIAINILDYERHSPLHVAASRNHFSMVKFLVQNGAFIDMSDGDSLKSSDMTNSTSISTLLNTTEKLYEAVKRNDFSEVQNYINLGAIVNVKHTGDVSPLHFASWKGFSEIVEVLLKKGANPNIIGKGRCTPLHYASKYSHIEVIKKLLTGGAIYNAETEKRKTPLELAERSDVIHVLKLVHCSFDGVEKGHVKVVVDLNETSDIDTVKCVMNARNKENLSIIVFADHCNYPHLKQLKEVGQVDISECLAFSSLLTFKGEYAKAIKLLNEQLDKRCKILGANNPAALEIEIEIIKNYYKESKFEKSLKMQEEILLKQRKILGENHEDVLVSESFIGLILHRLGRDEEALKIFEKVYPQQHALLGSHHTEVLNTQLHMGLVLHALDKLDEALKCNMDNLDKHTKKYGAMNPLTLSVKNNVAMVLASQENYEDAYNTYMEVHSDREFLLGPNHPDTLRSLSNAAHVRCCKEKSSESINNLQTVLDAQTKILGLNHVDTLNTKAYIAQAYLFQGKFINAYKIFSESGDARKLMFGSDHIRIKMESVLKRSIEETFSTCGAESYLTQPIKNDIFSAAANGEKVNVEDIVKSGANVNEQDSSGRTALHFAVSNGHKDVVRFLCKSGSDVTIMSQKGNTALHIAASKNYMEIVEIVLHFAKKSSPTKLQDFVNFKTALKGNTALHITEDTQIIKLLLSNGAIYNIRNKNEEMPIDVIKNKWAKRMLRIIDNLYAYVRVGNRNVVDVLQQLPTDEISAATKSRNADGRTLIQEAIINEEKNLASEILQLLD